jgi:hypothetical protein
METSDSIYYKNVRRLFFLIVLAVTFLFPATSSAQHWMSKFEHLGNYPQIKAATEAYFSEDTSRISNKACGYKDFNRWMTFMESRVDENGTLNTYSNAFNIARQQILNRDSEDYIPSVWSQIGPDLNTDPVKANMGLVTSLWVDQSNFTTIYAGSNSGGLFVTYNGGDNWECLTDKFMVTGVESIEIHPTEPGVIYLGTGFATWGKNYGVGVVKSYDDGVNWHETALDAQTYGHSFITKTIQNPIRPQTLFAIINFESNHGAKILRTFNGFGSFEEVHDIPEGGLQDNLNEIDNHPADTSTYYVSGSVFLKTINNGRTWEDHSDRIIDLSLYRLLRVSTAFHPTIPGKILVVLEKALLDSDLTYKDLLISSDNGQSFTSIVGSLNLANVGGEKMELEWSKLYLDQFYLGGWAVVPYRLLPDNTVELVTTGQIYAAHHDIREMKTYLKATINPPPFGTVYQSWMYIGNDGGVTKALEHENANPGYTDISRKGLNITQFYGMGIPADGSDFIVAGTQDGNFCVRDEAGNWTKPEVIGDAAEAVYSNADPEKVYLVTFCNGLYAAISYDKGKNWYSGSDNFINIGEPDNARRNDAPLEMSSTIPNRIYAGGSEVWRTNNGKDFTKISNFNKPDKIKAIREAPSDYRVVYVAKENPHWNMEEYKDKLYKTINNGSVWTPITPNVGDINLENVGIFDLAVDPNDAHTFYLALDRNESGKRVFKGTGETNITWTNMSEGLTNMPVNCLEIYKGSVMDEIFAGTDDGVYYRNKNMHEWKPFGHGLPFCVVSDIEIDYVNNEIIVSTFGRGIFRASLCDISPIAGHLFVEGEEVWDGLKRIPDNITIQTGGKLTITGEVRMREGKTIFVSKGGTLIVDGGKITNQCRDTFWNGIRVLGTAYGDQNLLYQGLVTLKNDAIIENAKIGIHCYNGDDADGGSSPKTGGGIIMAGKSTFRNNITAVQFEKYTHKNSISIFNFTNFVTDEGLFDGYEPKQFVRMNEIGGIFFGGCTFTNAKDMGDFNYKSRGIGIFSNQSHFVVDRKCETGVCDETEYKLSRFNNLEYGIYATSITTGKTFKVNKAFFRWNDCGIIAIGIGNVEINSSVFDIYENGAKNTGLYLDNSTGYIIEGNHFQNFSHESGVNPCNGIIINHSGSADNKIYRNYFRDLGFGIKAQGTNRSGDGLSGLVLKCNDFLNVNYDISVLPNKSTIVNGIKKSQGSYNQFKPNCQDPAGNLFSLLPISDYWSILNECEAIDYYHHNPVSMPRVKPYNPINITLHNTGLLFSVETCCPPNTSGGGGGSIDGATLAYKSEADTASLILTALIDEGNTEDKVVDLNLAAPAEALLVRDNLLQISPYVSDTVIKTAINREELLNNAMLRDIMVANPHSAKSEQIMQELDMRLDPMPEYMKDEILEGIFLLSDKELMEARRDMNLCLYQYGFSRLLSSSLTDTLAIPVDTLMALLSADGSSASLIRQAWVLLENGDTISALNRMANIDTEINLSIPEIAEIEQQQVFIQWLATNPSMDSISLEPLNNFMQSHSTTVSSAARGLLVANGLLVYDEPYLNPDLSKSSQVRNLVKNSVKPTKSLLKVYPNPAQDFITIEYNTNIDKANVVVELSDESGRKVYSQQLVRQLDAIILNTRNFKSGNYLVKLVVDNKTANSAKIVIAR